MTEIDLVSLQKEIDMLDRQLGQELENVNGRTKRIVTDRAFPLGSWIFAAVLVGFYIFGGSVPGIPYEQFKTIILLVAGLSVLVSIYLTFRFIWTRLAGGRKVKPIEESPKAIELRTKRDALRARVEEIRKAKAI